MSKWDNFEALARKNQTALGKADHPDNILAPINEQIETIRSQELDSIGRFKRNAIDRRAALESLRSMHEAQLEAAKHALKRAVDVEKGRLDIALCELMSPPSGARNRPTRVQN